MSMAAASALVIGLAVGLLISQRAGTWRPTCGEAERCLRSHDNHPRSDRSRR